ncbi:MAG: histidine kinase [Bacteroidetes bacterium]|nr:histidine kinase [Bacteroidota bacterium]
MQPAQSTTLFGILKKPRFKLWKVFLVVLVITAFFAALSLVVIYTAPGSLFEKSGFKPNRTFSVKDMWQYIFSLFFNTVFYFLSLNLFYQAGILKKKLNVYFLLLLGCIGLMAINHVASVLLFDNHVSSVNTLILIIGYFFILFFYAVIIFLFVSIASSEDQRRRNQELVVINTELELQKLKADYKFLKAQINPHFLHNSLNFLYSKSLPYSTDLSEGILTLSDIMRYSLSNEENADGKVLLVKEVEHIRNFIKMNQLRFDNKLLVDFEVKGILSGVTILPFVLITIIENAFKHGDARDKEHPLHLSLEVANNRIIFNCVNKKKAGPKDHSTGIGLDNIRKRLDIAYGIDYDFYIKDANEIYTVNLNLPV